MVAKNNYYIELNFGVPGFVLLKLCYLYIGIQIQTAEFLIFDLCTYIIWEVYARFEEKWLTVHN